MTNNGRIYDKYLVGVIIKFIFATMDKQENIKKKTGGSDKHLIVKSNTLMEGKFKFKLWEMRLFEMMISMIGREDTEFNRQRLFFSDLVKFFNTSDNNDYRLIKEAAESLADKRIYINYTDDKGRKRTAKLAIFPTVTYPDMEDRDTYDSYVELEFHTDLKPHLLSLQSNFKSYDIRNISQMRSVYSIRMFILLKKYEKLGKREFKLSDLKDILLEDDTDASAADDSAPYKLYADFKRRVILKPQEELSRFSDIRFEFVENRVGRRVESITFHIFPNQPEENRKLPHRMRSLRTNPPSESSPEQVIVVNEPIAPTINITPNTAKTTNQADVLYLELEAQVVRLFGVSPRAFMEIIDHNSEENIRQAARVTERALKEGKVKNAAGFFIDAVKNGYTDADEEKLRRRQSTEIKRKHLEKLKADAERLLEEKTVKLNDRIRTLVSTQTHVTDDAIEHVNVEYSMMIETIAKQKGRALTIEDYRQDEILRGLVIGTIVRLNRPEFEDILSYYEPRLADLQKEMKEILVTLK